MLDIRSTTSSSLTALLRRSLGAAQVLFLLGAGAGCGGSPDSSGLTSDELHMPPPRVGANVDVSNEPGPQSGADVTRDPTDAAHLVAGSNDFAPGANAVRVYESFDSGKTWTNGAVPLGPFPFDGFALDPAVAFDLAGNAYYVFTAYDFMSQHSALVSSTKAHASSTWGPVVTVLADDSESAAIAVDLSSGPFKGTIYVAGDELTQQGIVLGRSTDGGASFTTSRIPDSGGGSFSGLGSAQVAVGPDGEVYVVWSDASLKKFLINRSTDGGKTWAAKDDVVYAWSSSGFSVPADPASLGMTASIAVDRSQGPHRGDIYCAFHESTAKKGADVFAQRSSDGGVSWSGPTRVNDDCGAVVHDQFLPRLAVDPSNGVVNIAFYDTRNDPLNKKTDVYFARSADGARTFAPNIRVTTAPSDETSGKADSHGYGAKIGLSSLNRMSALLWTDSRSGSEEIESASVLQ